VPKSPLRIPLLILPELFASVEHAAHGLADVRIATSEWEAVHLLDKIDVQMREANLVLFDVSTWNINVAVEYGIARKASYNHRLLFCTDARYEAFRRGKTSVFSDIARRRFIALCRLRGSRTHAASVSSECSQTQARYIGYKRSAESDARTR